MPLSRASSLTSGLLFQSLCRVVQWAEHLFSARSTCIFPYHLSSVRGVTRRLEKLFLEGACTTQKSLEGKTHHDTAKIPLSLPDPYMLLAVTPSGDRPLLNENMGHLSFCSRGSGLLESNHRSFWLLISTGRNAWDAALLLTEDRPCWGFPYWPIPAVGICTKGQEAAECLFIITALCHMLVAQLRGCNMSLKTCASGTHLLK